MKAQTFTNILKLNICNGKDGLSTKMTEPNIAKTFDDILKEEETKWALFVGLNVKGVDELAIEGGEDPKDYHVTLLYGYFNPGGSDEDALSVQIQSAIDEVKKDIPESLSFKTEGRFEASKGSDGKDVIYAAVEEGQLEDIHEALLKALKKNGIVVEKDFDTYQPHMTLAYIDPEEEYELEELDHTATITKIKFGYGAESTHDNEYTIKKTDNTQQFNIMKTDDDKRLIFGWASVAIKIDGEQVVDHQKDMIDPDDLEEAVYEYVLNFRDGGEEHIPKLRKKARMVESCMFTKEKMEAMGIPEGIVPEGWWIGFYVDDDDAWEKVKNGTYQMFSIEGQGVREEVEDEENVKKNDDIAKFNPYHGKDGRFASKNGGGAAGTTAPKLMSPKDFDKYVSENGLTTIYRGYSAGTEEQLKEYADSIKQGTASVSGDKSSALGEGVYFAASKEEATGYMQRRQQEKGDKYGRVSVAALDKDSKVVEYSKISQEKWDETFTKTNKAFEAKGKGDMETYEKLKDEYYKIHNMSISEYATSKGYDAMYDPGMQYTVVINQNALVVRND